MKNVFLIFLLFFGAKLHAQENPFGITLFGNFLHTERVPNALFFFSDIEPNDSFELRRALRVHEINTIVLASDGGSVWESLTMAGIIFDRGINTFVPKLTDDKGCFSACAFMFFAGHSRVAEGQLAVHQVGAYDEKLDNKEYKLSDAQQATQYTTSEIIGFLNEFGTPPWVYEKMFRSRELYLFDEKEKSIINKINHIRPDSDVIYTFLADLDQFLGRPDSLKDGVSPSKGITSENMSRSLIKLYGFIGDIQLRTSLCEPMQARIKIALEADSRLQWKSVRGEYVLLYRSGENIRSSGRLKCKGSTSIIEWEDAIPYFESSENLFIHDGEAVFGSMKKYVDVRLHRN